MNAEEKINYFYNLVGLYMKEEYDEKYSEKYGHIPTNKMRDIVAGYYWGGNNIPDTAGLMVDYFKSQGI